ncbi:uncharacterized protein MEPE_03426 [Melanopsichium pennsylvanicum]|uniref:Enterotoxin n=1 Tax=Melanopsichium pennsylvanicum TaxID=63383 RepID=A0AAJ4XMS9_9BASI|nr:uncharacterized protein MEPE_03426 [Melanopsichium pennsylvanicum]
MAGTYRIFLILAVLAVSRVCHAMDDHIWKQLGDLPEAARELSSWHEFNPGQSLHPNDDTSAHFSGQHPGPSSFAFVPHSHTPSSSHAGQVIQAAESHWRPFPEGDPILHFDTATGLPKHPQPLTIREREEILQPIAMGSSKTFEASEFQPLHSGTLTAPLADVAYGYKNVMYKYGDERGIYFTHGQGSSSLMRQIAKEHGDMETKKNAGHQLHVWKRFNIAGQPGSVFQYVGKVETAMLSRTFTHKMHSFKSQRGLQTLGPDSIYDRSTLKLVSAKPWIKTERPEVQK